MAKTRKNVTTGGVPILSGTPREHGFAFPAEWERHAATWFSWPRPEGISFPGKYHTVPANIAAIVQQIVGREKVCINVPNENYERIVREQLIAGGVSKRAFDGSPAKRDVRFFHIPTNESWCRDHGPAFVTRKGRGGKREFAIVEWGFNAWGGKYPPYDSDDAVPVRVAESLRKQWGAAFKGVFFAKHKGAPVIMEGGSVEFNGRGTVMTSESCLLNPNRNPSMSRKEIERSLCDYYGQSHVVWLGDGIVGDDTDGHIDDLARFIDSRTIVTTVEEDPKDRNYKILKDNLRRVELAKDQNGKPFRVITLPMPGRVEHDGERLPATYANFYFVNGAVLVPTYRHRKNDAKAIRILQAAMPKREVIGVDCFELIWGLGSIHCLTQQQPA